MSTKTKTGIGLILAIVVALVLLLGGKLVPLARSEGLGMSGGWGGVIWVLAPPLLMLGLFTLLVWVIFMQKD